MMSAEWGGAAPPYDLLVVGGGINGVGIARDAAGRGLSVLLVERGDLAAATSSASSKLVHGGLRYLEQHELRLVRESLAEREVLWASAPHIIRPLRFVLPVHKGLRPPWLLRLGLFLYDHIGGRRRLPPTRTVRREHDAALAPLQDSFRLGFEYSDCQVDDARLVVLNALDALERGARVAVQCALRAARRVQGLWQAELISVTGERQTVRARALVNAAGPWVEDVLHAVGMARRNTLRLVKGSHVVVPRLYDGTQAYTLQNADGRIVFIIPYEDAFTLIGTTDVPFVGDAFRVRASEMETAYLCEIASGYLRKPVTPGDVIWSYAGVRPLWDDGDESASTVTRDYVFDLDAPAGAAPLLSVFGGKLTTYRKLAEHALQKLQPLLGLRAGAWTRGATLPGGDLPGGDFEGFAATQVKRYGFAEPAVVRRLCRAYGTRIEKIMGNARRLADLGEAFGRGLYESELQFLRDCEWARTGEDVLWRRSKLGLRLDAQQRAKVADWFTGAHAARESAAIRT